MTTPEYRNIEIDNIATDLNGKLDIDMTNMGTLSTLAISKLKEALEGDSSSSSTGSSVNSVSIIDTYGDSASYYIVFSNGYCIQGGYHDFLVSNASPVTITLLKTYASLGYSLNVALTFSGTVRSDSYGGVVTASSQGVTSWTAVADQTTTSSFSVTNSYVNNSYQTYSNVTVNLFSWQASGYLATGQY